MTNELRNDLASLVAGEYTYAEACENFIVDHGAALLAIVDDAAAARTEAESFKHMYAASVGELAEISAAVGTPNDEALNYNGPQNIIARIRRLQSGTGLFSDEVLAELSGVTRDLVFGFAVSLAEKLLSAQRKYGYADGWVRNDWMDECRAKLLEHVAKGDPRDVAAYCAFLWHHGESTTPPAAANQFLSARGDLLTQALDAMAALHQAMELVEEGDDVYIEAPHVRKFVDEHARLLYEQAHDQPAMNRAADEGARNG